MAEDPAKSEDQSLPATIAAGLRDAILAGDLASDERLPGEQELAERFGVSRTPIREALQRLETQSLLARDGRSLIVASLDHNQMAELYVVRAELEGVGEAGKRGFGRLSQEMEAANARLAGFSRRVKVAAAAAVAAATAAGVAIESGGEKVGHGSGGMSLLRAA